MVSRILQFKKRILFVIFGVLFVFLVPFEFYAYTAQENTGANLYNLIFYIQFETGPGAHPLFRWTFWRFPLSIALVAASMVFFVRLLQQRKKAYPIFSASAVTIVLWSIPLYYLVLLFSVNQPWSEIVITAPIPIGICGLLFMIFVILPSISWFSNAVIAGESTSAIENKTEATQSKRVILSPKNSSYLIFIASFLLPGLILWQSYTMLEGYVLNVLYPAFLLQHQTILTQYLSTPSAFQYSYFMQEIVAWTIFGIPMICCAPSLLFAWFVMRYVHGKSSRRSAILVGILSEIPPAVYAIFGYVYEYPWLIIPLPAVFIVGLLLMRFTHIIPQRKRVELTKGEIAVPLKLRVQSRFGRQKEIPEKTQETENLDTEEEERQPSSPESEKI